MSVTIVGGASGSELQGLGNQQSKVRANPVPAASRQDSGQASAQIDEEALHAAVKKLKESVASSGSDLSFSVDGDTGKTIVRVVDRTTGSVIRQIPSEEMIDIAKSVSRMQGMLLKEQA